jgi:hypothetical protein
MTMSDMEFFFLCDCMERRCLCQQTLSSVSENNIAVFFKAVAGEWPLTNRVADSGERGFPHIRLRSEGDGTLSI